MDYLEKRNAASNTPRIRASSSQATAVAATRSSEGSAITLRLLIQPRQLQP